MQLAYAFVFLNAFLPAPIKAGNIWGEGFSVLFVRLDDAHSIEYLN